MTVMAVLNIFMIYKWTVDCSIVRPTHPKYTIREQPNSWWKMHYIIKGF